MNLAKALTPKETEEIKPGLFIQRRGNDYKQISPAAWEGKIIWKNLLFGGINARNLIWFAIILFLAWSYFHDTKEYRDFYVEVNSNPIEFCTNVNLFYANGIENNYPLQSNFGESPTSFLER